MLSYFLFNVKLTVYYQTSLKQNKIERDNFKQFSTLSNRTLEINYSDFVFTFPF